MNFDSYNDLASQEIIGKVKSCKSSEEMLSV